MTATILESTVVETVEVVEEDNLAHIVCHCKGMNIAWCGLDVRGHVLQAEMIDLDEACPLCLLADDMYEDAGTCPWGCNCSSAENFYFCGHYDDEETTHDHPR